MPTFFQSKFKLTNLFVKILTLSLKFFKKSWASIPKKLFKFLSTINTIFIQISKIKEIEKLSQRLNLTPSTPLC